MNVGVGICPDLVGLGIDPHGICGTLGDAGISAAIIPGSCRDPDVFSHLAERGWDRVVLAACDEGPSRTDVRTACRRAGLDPVVGAVSVDVASVTAFGEPARRESRAASALAAKAAGLRATAPSPPEALRMVLPSGDMSRRSLLSLAGVTHMPVAVTGLGSCRGSGACGLCVDACPVDAVVGEGALPRVEKDRCIGCGACVVACPVEGAARLPGADLERFEAEIGRLLSDTEDATSGLLVSCSGSPPLAGDRLEGEWLPVEVPCLSVVTPSWALAALASGAGAVAFRGCGDACSAGAPERVVPRVEFTRSALTASGVGDARERVRVLLPDRDDDGVPRVHEPLRRAGGGDAPISLREPEASASALRALGASGGLVAMAGSPFGTVGFEHDGCTMCGLCAAACPTRALRFDQGPVAATLEIDPIACVGCGHCADVCPEHVLTVEPAFRLEELSRGSTRLKASPLARCKRCGDPIAPVAMLDRLRLQLDEAVLDTVEGLCQRCRGIG
jgi:ferredoxin